MQGHNDVKSDLHITVIIPAYNEEKRITTCLTRTLQYCTEQQWSFEIIVAVDGSIDNTAKIVQNFHSRDNRVKLLSFRSRLGKGRAIINAIRMASNEYIAYIDADLSADPSELVQLLKYVDNYDIVVGSRLLRGNLPPIKRSIVRSFFLHVYSIVFRMLFRLQIYDSQCGFRILRRHAVSNILPEIDSTGSAFDSELLVIASMLGLRIKEVPISWRDDVGSNIDVIKQTAVLGTGLLLIWTKVHLLQLKNEKQVHIQNETIA